MRSAVGRGAEERLAVSRSVAGLVVVLSFAGAAPLGAEALEVRWSRSEIHWAQPVTLEVAVDNPAQQTRAGSIVLSFSEPVLVVDQSPGSPAYFDGARVLGLQRKLPDRRDGVRVETWFRYWLPKSRRSAWVTIIPVRSGPLTVKARAIWVRSGPARSILHLPRRSSCVDRQGYPASCHRRLVQESPELQESLRQALDRRVAWNDDTFEQLQRLLRHPTDRRALAYFGVELDPGERRLVERYAPMIRDKLRDPRLRDHPQLLSQLLRLVRDPFDREALAFLGFSSASSSRPDDPREAHVAEVQGYLADQQGGTNLLSLIAAEGDIRFGHARRPGMIVIEYRGRAHSFRRGPDVIVRMIERLIEIKPRSKYIHGKEEVSGYSYLEVLHILRKE